MAMVDIDRGSPIQTWHNRTTGVTIDCFKWQDAEFGDGLLLEPLQERAAQLNSKVFKQGIMNTAKEISFHMQMQGMRTLLMASIDDQDIGMCIQQALPVTLNGQRENVLWTAVTAIDESFQKTGIARDFRVRSAEMYAWLGVVAAMGRTRHPGVLLSIEDAEIDGRKVFGTIIPIARPREGQDDFYGEAREALEQVVPQTLDPSEVVYSKGLALNQFKGPITGIPLEGSERYNLMRDRMRELGVDIEGKNALYYYAPVLSRYDARVRSTIPSLKTAA